MELESEAEIRAWNAALERAADKIGNMGASNGYCRAVLAQRKMLPAPLAAPRIGRLLAGKRALEPKLLDTGEVVLEAPHHLIGATLCKITGCTFIYGFIDRDFEDVLTKHGVKFHFEYDAEPVHFATAKDYDTFVWLLDLRDSGYFNLEKAAA
jgi:hypothetical protein